MFSIKMIQYLEFFLKVIRKIIFIFFHNSKFKLIIYEMNKLRLKLKIILIISITQSFSKLHPKMIHQIL